MGFFQGNKYRHRQIKQSLLHVLDKVFSILEDDNNPHRPQPISIKKILKSDGNWDIRKIIFSWIIDTIQGNIELSPHRVARLYAILASILQKMKVIATK